MEGIPQLIWRATDKGDWTWCSAQWMAYTGQSQNESHAAGWLEALHPEDRAAAQDSWKEAVSSNSFEIEYRIYNVGRDSYRWFQTRATSVFGNNGQIIEWLGTSTDIHHLRQLQAQQKILVAELQHRTRNLLYVVQEIAGQLIGMSTSLSDFETRFQDRLAALSRVQGLISRAEHEPITIGRLIQMELEALGATLASDRIALNGPEVQMDSAVVQTMALAIHELATNARKYGALATPHGFLFVTWRVHEGAPRNLWLEWIERGIMGNRGSSTGQHRGFGRQLIEDALPYQFGASTSLTISQDEVVCIVNLPLDS
ncbi:sensor histidine kinase [Sphingomonas qilianensis]|uniref:histidine kinase n=1 Tax=Sphingomonas qilianensis TaxID=1736690 RepID=A0ABU9XU22_9SPHN